MPTHQGSIRLFRAAGIVVFLHWSWFLVAAYEINGRGRSYSSLTFNVLEYLALFLIVLMMSSDTHWPAGRLEAQQIRSCCGRSAEWRTWTLPRGRVLRFGASLPDRW
jgi:hypothetical protein